MSWYVQVLKKYAEFNGRARRTEYWMFTLVNIIIGFAFYALDRITPGVESNATSSISSMSTVINCLYSLYALAIFLPSLAVLVRRLHDTGKSGWWVFISLIPIIGGLWLLFLTIEDSQPGINQYGPNPTEGTVNMAQAA